MNDNIRGNLKTKRTRTSLTLRTCCITVAAALGALALASGVSWGTVASTKHNFGSLGTSSLVRSTDSTEICVFCHAPHNSSPKTALWNKKDIGTTYNVYESQTLAATKSPNSPTLGQPTGSSKLCLTCHDGTIAIGSLTNASGAGRISNTTLAITGPGIDSSGKISPTKDSAPNPAYIGTDLRNDHPISFGYSRAYPSNPEINAPTYTFPQSFTPSTVKLDTSADPMVQCTSCHDPHGSAYPKFLVATYEYSASSDNKTICTACHNVSNWSASVHKNSTAVWTGTSGTDQNPWHIDMGSAGYTDDTPQIQSCLACHTTHAGATYLSGTYTGISKALTYGINPSTGSMVGEEWTCLNCHNGKLAAKDISTPLNYSYKHDVKGISDLHVPSRVLPGDYITEEVTFLNTPNRHAECADCHNSHTAQSGNHTVGGTTGNNIGNNILGSWGIKPVWAAAGSASTSFVSPPVQFTLPLVQTNNLEGYLCVKCHSSYAYSIAPPNVPSGNADGSSVYESDITADFNINNMSVHPVFTQGKNTPSSTANSNWPDSVNGLSYTFMYGYCLEYPGSCTGMSTVTHTSTITCSDCHASGNLTGGSPDAKGVHGSQNKWLLRSNETGSGTAANLCYNCHRRDVYGDENFASAAQVTKAKYARVKHPVDGLANSSPFYQSGATTGNNTNRFGILCLTCHGGEYDATNNIMQGVHGSNAAAGSVPGSASLGNRLMNGSCVDSYTSASTSIGGSMKFKAATDKVCSNAALGTVTIPAGQVTYDY